MYWILLFDKTTDSVGCGCLCVDGFSQVDVTVILPDEEEIGCWGNPTDFKDQLTLRIWILCRDLGDRVVDSFVL